MTAAHWTEIALQPAQDAVSQGSEHEVLTAAAARSRARRTFTSMIISLRRISSFIEITVSRARLTSGGALFVVVPRRFSCELLQIE